MTKALLLTSMSLPCVMLLGCGFPVGMPGGVNLSPRTVERVADSDPENLRVMSFNLRTRTIFDIFNSWSSRRELLAKTIRRFDPDLLGTQECRASQGEYVRAQLPEYEFVGVGRDDGRMDGEMCGVFFKSERFEKLDEGHFWLSETPDQPGSRSWGSWFRRMVTWVKLQHRDSEGRVVYFFNTHFDSNSKRARIESARLLREKIDAIAGDGPAIVTGDFNTGEGSPPYQLVTDGGWVDTFREANPDRHSAEGTRHGFRGGKSGQRIDWIVTTPDFTTLHASIDRTHDDGRYPSDHFPVTAVLRLDPSIASTAQASADSAEAPAVASDRTP